MSKVIPIFLLLCMYTMLITAQNLEIDSLKHKASQETDVRKKIELYNLIAGSYYSKQLRYDSAFVYLKKIRSISKEEGIKDMEAFALNNQAIIYQALGNKEKSLDYFNQGLALFKKLNNPTQVALLYNNIGMIHKQLEEYETALTYLDSALTIANNGPSKRMLGIVYTSIGEVNYKLTNFDTSTSYLKKGIQILDSINVIAIDADIVLAKSYQAQEKIDTAITYAQKALKKAKKQKAPKSSYEISRLLSSMYGNNGDSEKEVLYLKKALMYNDSLSKSSDLSDIELKELEEEQKAQEVQLQSLKNKDIFYILLYVVGAIILLVLGILIFKINKNEKLNEDIYEVQKNLIQSELDRRGKSDHTKNN